VDCRLCELLWVILFLFPIFGGLLNNILSVFSSWDTPSYVLRSRNLTLKVHVFIQYIGLLGAQVQAKAQILRVYSVIYVSLCKNNDLQGLLLTEAQKISSGLATDNPEAH